MNERLAWIRSEIVPHAVAREELPDGVAWELDEVAGLEDKLDLLVALERECCSGVVVEHRRLPGTGHRRLEVRGMAPGDAVLATSFPDPDLPRLGSRLAWAAGLGALLTLLLCCALPVAVATILGAVAAAPFASLDAWWVLAGAMLLLGGAAFVLQGRGRARSRSAARASCGC